MSRATSQGNQQMRATVETKRTTSTSTSTSASPGASAGAIAAGAIAAIAGVLVAAASVAAETRRVAVVVGHNAGGPGERSLRYAEDDAAKLADVLVELGDVDRSRLFLLRGKPSATVVEVLGQAAAVVRQARQAPDDRVLLTFFFSGHSDGAALQLGATRLAYGELRRLLAATGADVKLTIIDGCKSGAMVATKGGRPGAAFEIGLADQLATRGEATLTSSAADEASLESSEIRGSFFTHHLVSGLRGAADASGDGRVTLSEAYEHAFHRTVLASAATGRAPQHPNYDYQLTGGGELVLTRVGERSAGLRLPAGFSRALVINVRRDQVIAELVGDGVRTLAVAPGEYAVRLWRGSLPSVGRVRAAARELTEVTWEALERSVAQPVQGKSSGAGAGPVEPEAQLPLSPQAQAVWDRLALSVGDRAIPSQELAQAFSSKTYEGGKEVSAESFLRTAGRADLAKQVSERQAARATLGIGGGAAALAGLAWMAMAPSCDFDSDGDCAGDRAAAYGFGSLLLLGGGALVVLAVAMDDDRPKPFVLRTLADEYNRGLRSRLLSGELSAEPASAAPGPGPGPAPAPAPAVRPRASAAPRGWQLQPRVAATGAGLFVVGRF